MTTGAPCGAGLEERLVGEPRRFDKVAVCSGHMVDLPGRSPPRFPAEKEGAVRTAMAMVLDGWGIGRGDLAVCGGARGADILFAELCLERGAHVQLLIALPEDEFLARSVRMAGDGWNRRYHDLRRRSETWFAPKCLGPLPEGVSPFERNNLWVIETGEAEAPPERFFALLVWDEQPTGDGPGGTSHFAAEVRRFGGRLAVINPTMLGCDEGRNR